MFNIQKAVSRLNYAPRLSEIEITDIKKGIGVFVPKPDKAVSFAELKESLKKAGYTLASAAIIVSGAIERDGDAARITSPTSQQRFRLEGSLLELPSEPSRSVQIKGDWKSSAVEKGTLEVITVESAGKVEHRPERPEPTRRS